MNGCWPRIRSYYAWIMVFFFSACDVGLGLGWKFYGYAYSCALD